MDNNMKPEEYMQRNLIGFEGDTQMRDDIQKIITKLGITHVVETGTYKGGSTKVFAEMEGVQEVHTIELNEENFNDSEKYLADCFNVIMHKGSSEKVLRNVIPHLIGKKILFFLDAHWEEHCPLLEELEEIAAHGIKPVIIIHDFKVPGSTLGFDSYKGQDFEFEWILKSLYSIYDTDFVYVYNDPNTALGARRGAITIY
jgi:predicted O-methyltransferase YrrM